MENGTVSASSQLQYFITTLGSPMGIAAILVFLLCLALVLFFPALRWVYLILMLWAATLAFYFNGDFDNRLAWPLEQIRAQGRGISAALLVLLTIPSIAARSPLRSRVIGGGAWAMFLFQLAVSVRHAMVGDLDRGVVGGFVLILTFLVLGYGVPKWVQTIDDAKKILRVLAGVAGLFVLGTIYQLAMNASAIKVQGRLMGTTGNPQHAGTILALCIPAICYMVITRTERFRWRFIAAGLVGIMVVFLLWSGSRTCVGMAAISLIVLFRFQFRRVLLMALVGGISVAAVFYFYRGTDDIVNEHLISTEDTRSAVWAGQFHDFMRAPLFGSLEQGSFGVGENSYLATASNFGIFGTAPLLLSVGLTSWGMIRLWRCRARLGQHAMLAELIVAGLLAAGVGALFEGYLVATLAFPMYFVYIYQGMLYFLLQVAESPQFVQVPASAMQEYDDYIDIPAYRPQWS